MGRTCAGKDTIVNELIKKYGYKKLVSYTTRPMRVKEKQDIDYHFIKKEEFLDKIENDFFIEYKKFDTTQGEWWYGSAKDDYLNSEQNTIKIIDPKGLQDILYKIRKNELNIDPICIYIHANNKTIEQRLIERGDEKEEAKSRLDRDNKDFSKVQCVANRIFYNNGDKPLSTVVDEIHEYIQRRNYGK